MLKQAHRALGFTLIEVMTVITVLAMLIAIAVPSMGAWLQNQQVRVAADAILNGLQIARSEAIRRNVSVQIAIDTPQTGWSVNESAAPQTLVQSRTHEEGSPNANVLTTPGGATTITFTPLGGVTSNTDGSLPITRIDISNPAGGPCQTAGSAGVGMRCLRIQVTAGGSTKLCDPVVPVATPPALSDPRAC